MASLDARKTPLPTLWKPIPIFLCPFVANNEVLRILIKISFPRPYFSSYLFIQVYEQDYTSSASFLRAFYQRILEYRAPSFFTLILSLAPAKAARIDNLTPAQSQAG